MRKVLSIIMASLALSSMAQTKMLTMEQLTPGHPDYLAAKALQQVKWNDQNALEYKTPEQVESEKMAKEADKGENKPLSEKEKVLKNWRESLPKEEGIVYGQSVHRNEFGISGGIFWAPESESRFAFYRMDESMVGQYPLLQTDPREAEVKWIRYPMAGMTSHQVTLGIYDASTHATVYVKSRIEDPEHYYTCVSWRPDGKQIFIAELNRLQNYMELNVYDAQTGEFVETLFSESDEKYVEPEHPLFFLPGSNDEFIWQSRRDGYNHLYLYNLTKPIGDGNPYQLTKGEWEVIELLGVDPKNPKTTYFMATKEDPRERHLYRLTQSYRVIERITTEPGVHNIKLSPDFSKAYDMYSNPTTPRVCQLLNLKKRSAKPELLYSAADPYADYAKPEVEAGVLKAADGTSDLYYRLVKPVGFDASKQYPVVVYLYNGPHAQMITEGYLHGLPGWDYYMAQQGYAVFTIDGRGSANRGLAFEQAIWHNLGDAEGKDQIQGVAYLRTLPWIDANRIGIYGWSYGGFMTTYMMINYPETFKVGVCGGPVLDWSRYEVMYGERYMGTPDNNPDGYARNCMVNHAGELKGRLLIIHDDQDDTVVPQMSVQFLKKTVETGTYPDFMIYANHPHNVRGKDRAHLLTRIAQYFIEHL